MNELRSIYRTLLRRYGPQGWWPLVDHATMQSRYNPPSVDPDAAFFEVSVGAILTQNMAWKNAERALVNLILADILNPSTIATIDTDALAEYIRPAGYYNQKSRKLQNFVRWYTRFYYSSHELQKYTTECIRNELLGINGVGPETADSILLYALSRKVFVVDAYTRRLFKRLGFVTDEEYHTVQELFHHQFHATVAEYKEYHALIVEHAKWCCKKTPCCDECVVYDRCRYTNTSSVKEP